MDKRINVTKTFLPPIEEYEAYVRQIWESDWLTNQGPLLLEFEKQMRTRLGVQHFQMVSNGTMALQLALRALDITEGEVITTPFTYVATTSSILWEHCKPVFVDILPDTLCIDPSKIEAAITDKTKAIMPVHVFGNPCEVEAIDAIAQKHNLPVIYDAAHAFGVMYKGKSLLDYGDISICSFHATKLFHTIEGGGLIARDAAVNEKLELLKRFGHNGDEHYMLGINAKATEFQAAMGLCNLKYVDNNIEQRKKLFEMYGSLLSDSVQKPREAKGSTPNYAYYPVVCKDNETREKIVAALNAENIFPRRYFYPSLNKLPYVENKNACPVSEDMAGRILCLPFYPGLEEDVVGKICELIKEVD